MAERAYDSDRLAYHRDHSRVSSSGMREYLKGGWEGYQAYISKDWSRKTMGMRIGSIANDLIVFGPDKTKALYTVAGQDRRKAEFREALKAAPVEDQELVVTHLEWSRAMDTYEAFKKNRNASGLMKEMDPEVGIRFEVEGLPGKALMDGFDWKRGIYMEVKRTNLRVPYHETCERFDYYGQAAWNSLAVRALTGKLPLVVWLVCYEGERAELVHPDSGRVLDKMMDILEAAPGLARQLEEESGNG